MVESNLSEIPSEVIRTLVRETVEKKLKSKNVKINVSSASKAGENNFIGIIYRVSFSSDDKNEANPISSVILKVAPQNLARRQQFFSRPCFIRECYMYLQILPFFRQFEQSKGVIIEDNGFIEYPECYGTSDNEFDECVLLEDLSVRKFSIIDRYTQDITADHVCLVMQALGKFHAISFALKDQQPEKFNEFASNLDENFIRKNDPMLREFFAKQCETVFTVLSKDEDAHLMAKLKKLLERHAMDVAADCLDLEATGGAAVIAHGDMWQNNTMFRYDNNGKPIEICLVDWQISRISSPIIDIVYYMFCCTTKELRDNHYDNFLKIYHESLSTHIKKLGSDPEELFSYKTMLEHFHKFAKFGLILSTVLLPIITLDSGSGVNLDVISEDVKNGKEIDAIVFMTDSSTKRFNKRLRDVIIDMDRLDYI